MNCNKTPFDSMEFEGRSREIKNSKGPFDCVRFIREKTGWGLEEYKRFMIQL